MFALVSAALAAPNLLPGADPLDAGDGVVRAGALAIGAFAPGGCTSSTDCGGAQLGVFAGPVLRAEVGITDRLSIAGEGLAMVGPEGALDLDVAGGALAVRALVVDTEHVHVAPWIGAVATGTFDLYALTGGVALDAGGERVRFDLSVPLAAVSYDGTYTELTFTSLLASEAGVSWNLGRGHAVRVGMWSLAPGVGWSWTGERWTADAAVHSVGAVTIGEARVGVRF